jgi:hypothetical protein
LTTVRLLGAAAVAAAALAGCGGSDTAASPERFLTVQQAVDAEGPVRVRGTLIANAEGVRLCSAILESHPPQCGKPSLSVRGLDLVGVSNMEQAKGVGWTSREVTLEGTVDDGVLTIAS